MKVFLAEDNPDDTRAVKRAFGSANAQVELRCFGDGLQLVDALKQESPSCILLDMDMPYLDGFGVMEFLQSESSVNAIPVFVLASSSIHQELLKEQGCRPSGFLKKPFTYREFLSLFKT